MLVPILVWTINSREISDEPLRVFADEPRQRREVERYNSAVNGGWMDVD